MAKLRRTLSKLSSSAAPQVHINAHTHTLTVFFTTHQRTLHPLSLPCLEQRAVARGPESHTSLMLHSTFSDLRPASLTLTNTKPSASRQRGSKHARQTSAIAALQECALVVGEGESSVSFAGRRDALLFFLSSSAFFFLFAPRMRAIRCLNWIRSNSEYQRRRRTTGHRQCHVRRLCLSWFSGEDAAQPHTYTRRKCFFFSFSVLRASTRR